ncbi:unnamed protein product, partial [marine sediment metagenome]
MAIIDKQVAATADDALMKNEVTLDAANTRLRIYSDVGRSRYSSGARFLAIDIPLGSTITTAYAEFYVYHAGYDDLDCTIYGNNVDDAKDFVDEADVDGRAKTAESVAWSEDSLGIGWKGSTKELKAIIQEIIDRPGWVANQDMVILWIHGSFAVLKECVARSWDGDPAEAPKLHIEYDPPAAPPAGNSPGTIIRSFAAPDQRTLGLTWDSRTLWLCDDGTDR